MSNLPDLDYQSLASSVIAQAIEDVTCRHGDIRQNRPTDDEVRGAYLFLCSNRQPFYSDRDVWCSIAGYDGQELRKKVISAIELGIEYRVSDFTADTE